MMKGFRVHLIYTQIHPVRSEGRTCWTVSPKLPYKSPCMLNVPILQNTVCLPFLLHRMVFHNLSTNTQLLTNNCLPCPSAGKEKMKEVQSEENKQINLYSVTNCPEFMMPTPSNPPAYYIISREISPKTHCFPLFVSKLPQVINDGF